MLIISVEMTTLEPMKLSLRGEYALRALLVLTMNYGDQVVRIQTISDQQRIPKKFLEQILNDLKNLGAVESKRGINGGYRLARPPENITLADIKVGDSVMATGTLKGGAFTVLKMGVTEPAAPGAARRRGANDQPAPAAPAGQTPEPLSGVPPPPPM